MGGSVLKAWKEIVCASLADRLSMKHQGHVPKVCQDVVPGTNLAVALVDDVAASCLVSGMHCSCHVCSMQHPQKEVLLGTQPPQKEVLARTLLECNRLAGSDLKVRIACSLLAWL